MDQFNHISSCESAFEIWKTLETIYEGSFIKLNKSRYLLTRKYELFEMKGYELISDMLF